MHFETERVHSECWPLGIQRVFDLCWTRSGEEAGPWVVIPIVVGGGVHRQ